MKIDKDWKLVLAFTLTLALGVVLGGMAEQNYRLKQVFAFQDRMVRIENMLLNINWNEESVKNFNDLGLTKIKFTPPKPKPAQTEEKK